MPISLIINHFFPNDHHYFFSFPFYSKSIDFIQITPKFSSKYCVSFTQKKNDLFSENVLHFFFIIFLLTCSFRKMEIKPQHNSQPFVALSKISLFTLPPNFVIHLHKRAKQVPQWFHFCSLFFISTKFSRNHSFSILLIFQSNNFVSSYYLCMFYGCFQKQFLKYLLGFISLCLQHHLCFYFNI